MIDAMRAALKELEDVLECINQDKIPFDGDDFHETLRNLRQAIAEAQKQEPVAKVNFTKPGYIHWLKLPPVSLDGDQLLYTAPVKREWVGLTREEIVSAYCSIHAKEWAIGGMDDVLPFTRAIEAKLRERNT